MKRLTATALVIVLAACQTASDPGADLLDDYEPVRSTTIMSAPEAKAVNDEDQIVIDHGAYLVELLGCGACHTDGALVGQPDRRRALAGSSIGIAFSNPLLSDRPAIVFPANLTPDPETGIGNWNEADIRRAIQHGVDVMGRQQAPVMPWSAYRKLKPYDVAAIAHYLRSLPPVRHQVPANIRQGQSADGYRYVHFGVYMSREAMEES